MWLIGGRGRNPSQKLFAMQGMANESVVFFRDVACSMQGVGVGAQSSKGMRISILASKESESDADHKAHHVAKCRECEHGAQAGVWIACQEICFEACRHGFRPRKARMGWSVNGMQEIGCAEHM